MTERPLQQIIESEQEPTEEERQRAQGFIDRLPARRIDQAMVLGSRQLTLDRIRREFAVVKHYAPELLTTTMQQLDGWIAGTVR